MKIWNFSSSYKKIYCTVPKCTCLQAIDSELYPTTLLSICGRGFQVWLFAFFLGGSCKCKCSCNCFDELIDTQGWPWIHFLAASVRPLELEEFCQKVLGLLQHQLHLDEEETSDSNRLPGLRLSSRCWTSKGRWQLHGQNTKVGFDLKSSTHAKLLFYIFVKMDVVSLKSWIEVNIHRLDIAMLESMKARWLLFSTHCHDNQSWCHHGETCERQWYHRHHHLILKIHRQQWNDHHHHLNIEDLGETCPTISLASSS